MAAGAAVSEGLAGLQDLFLTRFTHVVGSRLHRHIPWASHNT